jgi:carotenoid cleavage dioxygenase-like enzyme
MFGELPRVAPSTAGKRYRYAYAVDSSADAAVPFARIVRCDMDGGATMVWSSAAASPGEPVFVPRPGATDEDDGVVLAVVLDARARSSYLVVLDGRTLAELGRAVVPHPIPFGFHGLFAQNASE